METIKRILVLNYEFPPLGGGASSVAYELAKGYVKQGLTVSVVTMGYKGLKEFDIKDGVNIYRVKCLRKNKEICHPWEQATYLITAKRFLEKHLKENKYDICHCHFIIPTGILAKWISKKFRIPYILTAHGSDVPGYNPDRFKFLHYFTPSMLRKICKDAMTITAPSIYLASLIKEKIGNYQILIIPHGANDCLNQNINKENIIMSAGRLLKRKGFQYLIQAFNELNPDRWKLFIVGDGPYKKELHKLANHNENIIFTGWLNCSEKDFLEILNRAKIFSLLSTKESQGIVLIEGMSCGCAILSSNTSACKETVSKDVGYLVDGKHVEEIKKRLKHLMNNNDLLNAFMRNARNRYEEHFTYDNVIGKYMKVME